MKIIVKFVTFLFISFKENTNLFHASQPVHALFKCKMSIYLFIKIVINLKLDYGLLLTLGGNQRVA